MTTPVQPDQILLSTPSLRAVKSFVAAAKYQSFTRAAEALCVTQAAISRQIRELEDSLGVALFKRTGRAVELTEAGVIFYDAAYLSFVNITQAAQRIKHQGKQKKELSICCSTAFSSMWLSRRLPEFFSVNPDIDINVIATNNFLNLEPGIRPDAFINKVGECPEGYHSVPLFYDLVYPICSPAYLRNNPEITSLEGLQESTLLNLSPYGRSQIAEHVDWGVWFNSFGVDINLSAKSGNHVFHANDYNMLISMAINNQGVSLGWNHLVAPMMESGQLVRVGDLEVAYREKQHYLAYRETDANQHSLAEFRQWLLDIVSREPTFIAS